MISIITFSTRDGAEPRKLSMFCGVSSIVSCCYFLSKMARNDYFLNLCGWGAMAIQQEYFLLYSKIHRIISEHMIYELPG